MALLLLTGLGVMHERAAQLISDLALEPHPEGGYFRKVFHSVEPVAPGDHRGERKGLSAIYFLLVAGDASHWHRVFSDEAWHLYEGDPVELFQADPDFRGVTRNVMARVGVGVEPICVVPARHWQAARTTGEYSLVGCTVGPGFEYDDFELLRDDPDRAEQARQRQPDYAWLV